MVTTDERPLIVGIGGTSVPGSSTERALAIACGAERLFLLTDVPGVLDGERRLMTDLTPAQIYGLEADGVVSGGMIPKLRTCIDAVEGGVDAAVILDGRVPHAMLIELFTRRGAGTLIRLG